MNKELFKTIMIWLSYKVQEHHLTLILPILNMLAYEERNYIFNKYHVTCEELTEELGRIFLLLAQYNYPINLANIILIQKSFK